MLDRREVVAQLLERRGDSLVVTGLGSPTYDVAAVSPSDRNFYLWGAMGGAVMMGLGLAISQPGLPVLVFTGDGEALMGMGAFATVGTQRPPNLTVIVLDNEHYGETGMQPSHLGMGVDLCAVAQACGFDRASLITTPEALSSACADLYEPSAPKYLQIKIHPDTPPRVMPTRDGVENKISFRKALGVHQ